MVNSTGIILRRSGNSHYKMALLDQRYGRIECIVNSAAINIGQLIEYSMHEENGSLFLRSIEGIYTPLTLAGEDILFLHHILELLYYFAPIGSGVDGIFDLFVFLYAAEHEAISKKFKKFFLLKLLTLLGVSPELDHLQFPCVALLCDVSVDLFNEDQLSNEDEKKLDKWLWYCVWQHPYVNDFKTVHFLGQNRAI